jgi:hypothetical protein
MQRGPLVALAVGLFLLLAMFLALAKVIETETANLLSTTLLVAVTAYYAIHTQVVAEQTRRQVQVAERTLAHLQEPMLVLLLECQTGRHLRLVLANVGQACALRPRVAWGDGSTHGIGWSPPMPRAILPYPQGGRPTATPWLLTKGIELDVSLDVLPPSGCRMMRVTWEDARTAEEVSQPWAIGLAESEDGFVIEPQGGVDRRPITLR